MNSVVNLFSYCGMSMVHGHCDFIEIREGSRKCHMKLYKLLFSDSNFVLAKLHKLPPTLPCETNVT